MKRILKKLNSFAGISAGFPLSYMIPVYHCVSDEYLPHIKNIIRYKNSRDFEKDLDYISKNFEFIDWNFFKENYQKKSGKPYALLTFDDGLAEFRDVVMPVLKRKGIYAVNFINPEFIGNKDLMYRCKASLLAEKVKGISPALLNFLGIKNNSVEEAEKVILSIGFHQRAKFSEIAELLDVDFADYLSKHKVYLDFDDLVFAQNEGFGIAAHSWNHARYQELSLSEQLETTQKSLDYIRENHFLDEVFAFPFTDFGIQNAFFETLFSKNQNLIFTFGTAGIKTDSFPKNLQRISMENGFSAKEEIAFEKNYFWLKKFLNKNVIHRK
ncbi:MAG: polysaccharide deacetylase family protein [Bergeyella sp.]